MASDPQSWCCLSAPPPPRISSSRCDQGSYDSLQQLHLWSCWGRLPRKASLELSFKGCRGIGGVDTWQRQLRERKWHVAKHNTLILLGKGSTSMHVLDSFLCQGPNEVHCTVSGKAPPISLAPFFLRVTPSPLSWLEGFLRGCIGILFLESWNHAAGWILPYHREGALCSFNEAHWEGKRGRATCLLKGLFVYPRDLLVLFYPVSIFLLQVKIECGNKASPLEYDHRKLPTGSGENNLHSCRS